jgi:hypothetical protein
MVSIKEDLQENTEHELAIANVKVFHFVPSLLKSIFLSKE